MSNTEQSKTDVRQISRSCFADWEAKQLHNWSLQENRRLSNTEQLVDKCQQDHKPDTDHPCTDGGTGQFGVVMVVDDCSNLGIRAVRGEQRDFELGLLNNFAVFLWLLGNGTIFKELLQAPERSRGEVWIMLVSLEKLRSDLSGVRS